MKIKKRITALVCVIALSLTQVIGAYAEDEEITEQHTHSYVSEVTEEADCANEGEMTFSCACGESYTEVIPKTTSHKYGVGEVLNEAACGVEGKTQYTCKVCGESYIQVTPALSHELDGGEVTREATCAQGGIITYTCTLCGSTFDSETDIDPDNHVWDDGVVTKEASCKETGTMTYTCTFCGEQKTEDIAKTDAHVFGEGTVTAQPTCGKAGKETVTCTLCGETVSRDIPATGNHYFGKGEVIKAADCTHAGLKHYVCAGCGFEVDTIIPKSAVHSFDSGVVTKAPTLTSAGSKTYTCKLCKKTLVKSIPKLIDISKLSVSLSASSYTYDGKAKRPTVTVKNGSKTLTLGTDYTVTYAGNTRAGTTSVTVTGKGAYASSVKKTFSIIAADISKATVSGVKKTYTYTGKAIAPRPTVKLSSKTLILTSDYKLTYSANKAIGAATMTIKGVGNYKGTKKVTFSILPKAVTLKKLTSPKSRQLKVNWAKNSTVTGYQVVYSTNKSFSDKKTANVTSAATVTKTLTGLTSGKTYYVKVRCYKTIGKTKYYSAYSAVKSIKVK